MAAAGYSKPMVSTEYNGPGFFEFPANRRYFGLLQSWSQSLGGSGGATGAKNEPAGIPDLYRQMASLAPETQMFMMGCPEALERKLERLQARDMVIRNVLAFSAGVQRTAFWDMFHDTSKRDDLTTLLYGKLRIAEYKDGLPSNSYYLAGVFQRMAAALNGVESIRRIPYPARESVYVFEGLRRNRPALVVAWERRDTFSGEDSPAIPVELESNSTRAAGLDALGHQVPVRIKDGHLNLQVSVTPIFIETGP